MSGTQSSLALSHLGTRAGRLPAVLGALSVATAGGPAGDGGLAGGPAGSPWRAGEGHSTGSGWAQGESRGAEPPQGAPVSGLCTAWGPCGGTWGVTVGCRCPSSPRRPACPLPTPQEGNPPGTRNTQVVDSLRLHRTLWMAQPAPGNLAPGGGGGGSADLGRGQWVQQCPFHTGPTCRALGGPGQGHLGLDGGWVGGSVWLFSKESSFFIFFLIVVKYT